MKNRIALLVFFVAIFINFFSQNTIKAGKNQSFDAKASAPAIQQFGGVLPLVILSKALQILQGRYPVFHNLSSLRLVFFSRAIKLYNCYVTI